MPITLQDAPAPKTVEEKIESAAAPQTASVEVKDTAAADNVDSATEPSDEVPAESEPVASEAAGNTELPSKVSKAPAPVGVTIEPVCIIQLVL